ncbi:MAG: hypothetical protein Q8R86_08995 [Sulfuricurvum sp.]|nr:hypothetical protein [Sulfuricurvum sp.]
MERGLGSTVCLAAPLNISASKPSMIYGYHLAFSNELQDEHTPNTIKISPSDFIDSSTCFNIQVYQNNQEKNVTLATDRVFDKPEIGQKWFFQVEDTIEFMWETQSGKISYRFLAEATEDIFRFWLYHIVLPIYFSIGEVYKFLHAGAVEIEDKSVLFMAPSHGGKSTLTDYFIQRGHPLITDDKMATFEREGVYYAVPAHPYHRPFRTVEVLGHLCENPSTQIHPIHAIYILEKSAPDAQITIRTLKGIEKFSRLHEGGEMNFSFFTPQYVSYLAGLANRVNVFAITVPHDLERLKEVYTVITNHTLQLQG